MQKMNLHANHSPLPAPAHQAALKGSASAFSWALPSASAHQLPSIMQSVRQAIELQPASACQRQIPARGHSGASAPLKGLLPLRCNASFYSEAVTLTHACSSACRAESPQPDDPSPLLSHSHSHCRKAARRAAHDPQAGLQLLQALAGSGACTASDKENASTASPPLPVRHRPAAALEPPPAQSPPVAGRAVAAGVVSPATLWHRQAALPQQQQGHAALGLKALGASMDGSSGVPEAGQQPADQMQWSQLDQQQSKGAVSGWQQPQQAASAAQEAGTHVSQPVLEAGVRLLPGRHQFSVQVPGQVSGRPPEAQASQPQWQAAQPGSRAQAAPGTADEVIVYREPLGPGGRCTAQTAWASVVARSHQWRSVDAAREGACRGGIRHAAPADCGSPRSATLPDWNSVRRGGRPRQPMQRATGALQARDLPSSQATAAERQQTQLQVQIPASADALPAGPESLPFQASPAAGQQSQQGLAQVPAGAASAGAVPQRPTLSGAAHPSEARAETQPQIPQVPQQTGHLPLKSGSSLSSLVELHRRQQVQTLSAGQVAGSHPAAGQPALSSLLEVHRESRALAGRPIQAQLLQPWARYPQAAAAASETARRQAAYPQDRPLQVGLPLSLHAFHLEWLFGIAALTVRFTVEHWQRSTLQDVAWEQVVDGQALSLLVQASAPVMQCTAVSQQGAARQGAGGAATRMLEARLPGATQPPGRAAASSGNHASQVWNILPLSVGSSDDCPPGWARLSSLGHGSLAAQVQTCLAVGWS